MIRPTDRRACEQSVNAWLGLMWCQDAKPGLVVCWERVGKRILGTVTFLMVGSNLPSSLLV